MLIENQRYTFLPPGSGGEPIIIRGLQHYSPGQSRKVDVWQLSVPEAHAAALADKTECSSFGEVERLLGRCFCGGREQVAASLITAAS